MDSREEKIFDTSLKEDIKIINIEGVEYIYLIDKSENEKNVTIKLKEEIPVKYISFIYEASFEKIIKDIKLLDSCNNVKEIIRLLKIIFLTNKVTVEKREDKYFLIINIYTFEKISKYEIELKKKNQLMKKMNY